MTKTENGAKMKNLKKLLILLLLVICISCEKKLNSPSVLLFEKMEIHYTKSGGWIQTVYLDIWGNGLGNVHSQPQSPSADSTFWLTEDEKEKLIVLFSSFSDFNSYYEPDELRTDQNYHTIVFIYNQESDTVSVYNPERAKLPLRLVLLLNEMENIVQQHL